MVGGLLVPEYAATTSDTEVHPEHLALWYDPERQFSPTDSGRALRKRSVARTIQMDIQQTDVLATGVEEINCFTNGITDRTHCYDDAICILVSVVIKQMIFATGQLANLIHVLFNNRRNSQIERIGCFTNLEEYIWILSRTTLDWRCRIQ